MTPDEWAKYFRDLGHKENEKGEATVTVCAALAQAADEIERMRAEIEHLRKIRTAASAVVDAHAGLKANYHQAMLALDSVLNRYDKHGRPLPTKDPNEYRRASDARGPAQTTEKAKPSRHEGSGDACAGEDHRAPDPRRLLALVHDMMARLADLLDADQFNNIEAMVLDAGVPYPDEAESEQGADESIEQDDETRGALLCALYEWVNAGGSLDRVISAMDERYATEKDS